MSPIIKQFITMNYVERRTRRRGREEPFDENADSHGLTENDLLLETCDETDEVTKE